jgi:hypothetical protein
MLPPPYSLAWPVPDRYPRMMRSDAAIIAFMPAWAATLGAMRRHHVQLRSCCRRCGALTREELDTLICIHGEQTSLIDRQRRCRMVGCDGAAYYLASRGYDGRWHELLASDALRSGLGDYARTVAIADKSTGGSTMRPAALRSE